MELLFPSLPIIFSFLLFIFMLLKLGRKKLSKTGLSALKTPPGPWKLPIIGNIHQLIGPLPHHRIADMAKKYGPLMHLQLGEVPTIIISSAEMAKHVFKTQEGIFSSRTPIIASNIFSYNSTDMIFSPYGEYWKQLRKICTTELLSTKRVQSFKSMRDEEVSNVIQSITSSSKSGIPINVTENILSLTFGMTSRAAFGKKCKEQQQFILVVKDIIKAAGGFNVADLFPSNKFLHVISGIRPKLEKVHKITDQILDNIISTHKEGLESRRASQGEKVEEDLIDVLIKVQENDGDLDFPITTNNIKALIMDVFIGGSETSVTTIEWVMAEMVKNPKVMENAQFEVRQVFDRKNGKIDETDFHELKYMKSVIKETLRLHPVAPIFLPRQCKERCEINGYEIPFKSNVIINAWAIGRDPNYWTEPERFLPERFLDSSLDFKGTRFEFIPFGAGRRICPGMIFGLATVEIQLAHLLYHFDWKLPNGMKGEDLDMTEEFGLTIRRKYELCLIPIPYSHKSSIVG